MPHTVNVSCGALQMLPGFDTIVTIFEFLVAFGVLEFSRERLKIFIHWLVLNIVQPVAAKTNTTAFLYLRG